MTTHEYHVDCNETDLPLHEPIPLTAGQVPDWKSIKIKEPESVEPLVSLGSLSDVAGQIITSSVYFGEHSSSPYIHDNNRLEGRLLTLFARSSVASRLLTAEQLLPAGHHLIVFDAYRPLEVQSSLYRPYISSQPQH
jgi:D-alanyl-D-alanine dipeptidase